MGRESLKKLQDGVLESKGIYPVYVAVMLFASVFTPANNTARDIIQITLASVAFFPLLYAYFRYKKNRTREQNRILKFHTIVWGCIIFGRLCSYSCKSIF
ncbi:hypothetical protein [[Clostridium] symbiosum]|uniref:hypothetical protein n=1 Tax=Clostridium symbiosum TaxID=1512 RepID=UPI0006C7760F